MDDEYKWSIENPRTLEACCTRRKARERSLAYLSTLKDVCVVRSLAVGLHATSEGHRKAGMLDGIPLSTYLSIGMVAKLTMNLSPEHMHLYNGSRGIVRDVYYESNGYQSSLTGNGAWPIAMVEFSGYTGPALFSHSQLKEMTTPGCEFGFCGEIDLSKIVPISTVQRVCDCRSCSRRNLPLIPGKVDTLHSLQGVSVGEGEDLRQFILWWDAACEGRWPNIFYTGGSRAKDVSNVALGNSFCRKDGSCIGAGKRWALMYDEVCKIETAATSQLEQFEDDTEVAFQEAMTWLVSYGAALGSRTQNAGLTECMDQWRTSLDSIPWQL